MTKKNELGENVKSIEKIETKIAKKRGRKSAKELLELTNEKKDNITVLIEEEHDSNEIIVNTNSNYIQDNNKENIDNEIENILSLNSESDETDNPKPGAKKRGRKPKGGKIIQQMVPILNNKESKPNVILHLKCSLKDLLNTSIMGTNIEGFHFKNNNNDSSFEILDNNYSINNNQNKFLINNQTHINQTQINPNNFFDNNDSETVLDYDDDFKHNKENDIREVWKKLKMLEHNLHINNISDKKSACFWCTYDFDNPPIFIPKHFIKESYHVYGCFCSPECATAYLMEENIDSSSKFERYHLINHIYSKIYDYKKNIKPAPNPYYMLEKYYGNLNIQEYRSLLKNERLFLVVDKPLTRILPELHEDNDDFIINNKIIPSNTYQIKKKLQKKTLTKNNILNEKFGLVQQ
jgi:hypothetical protein